MKQKLSLAISLVFILLLGYCHYFIDLTIDKMYFCDQYKNETCLLSFENAQRTYRPQIPKSKTNSWYDLGYYMYFHTRQTPGLKINFSRALTDDELKTLKKSLLCEFVLTKGKIQKKTHMEGKRITKEGFWCFDYLGSNLVEFMKSQDKHQQIPEKTFFPIQLGIHFSSALHQINGQNTTKLYVDWVVEN